MKRRIFALVITLMMLVGLVGCSTQGEDQTEQQKQEPEEGESTELIVYGWSGNWDLWFADWAKEFEEEYGINIKYISGQGTAMRERIVAEDAAQSDIFISTPGDAFLLGNQGYLADIPYEDIPSAADVDEGFKYPQVCIWGYDVYSIAYNPDFVSDDEAPKSWKELSEEKWAGQVGMPLITDDTASRPAMILEEAYGREEMLNMLEGMYKNSSVLFDTPGRMESAIATGQCMVSPLALGNCNVVINEAGGNVRLTNPEEGCFIMMNSMTIMKNAPHYDAAVKFMEFYLSPKRQNNIMNELGISIAVNNTVEMDSEALSVPLGDLTTQEIIDNAIFPDWEAWMVTDENDVTKYQELMNSMQERIKQ
nr:extracellular solute-binding protein [Massilistercora timonensis]